MITKHDDKDLDRVEEIHLTQTQYIRWMSADTPRPDIFGTREGRVVLKDLLPARKPQQPPSILSALGPLAEAALGPGWKLASAQPAAPPPVPVRKLERPADAVWTFFCHNCLVVGVHDDGTVVAGSPSGGLVTRNTVSRPMAASMRAANWLRVLNSPSGRRREPQIICGEPWRVG